MTSADVLGFIAPRLGLTRKFAAELVLIYISEVTLYLSLCTNHIIITKRIRGCKRQKSTSNKRGSKHLRILI